MESLRSTDFPYTATFKFLCCYNTVRQKLKANIRNKAMEQLMNFLIKALKSKRSKISTFCRLNVLKS